MKKKRHSLKVIMRIVRESDSEPVSEVSRKHGIKEQTLYRWRRKYAGMDPAFTRDASPSPKSSAFTRDAR